MDDGAGGELIDLIMSAEAADGAQRFDLTDALRSHEGLESTGGTVALRAARLLAASGDPNDLRMVATLADTAHNDDVDGAGMVFAEALDKVTLYQGRPQPYGTAMVEHLGDVVQPPVDPTVSDAERAALGVPSLAELQQQAEQMSRDLAIERADAAGSLPPGQMFARVWAEPDPAELRRRLDASDEPGWADGDVLTLVSESDVPFAATPVFPMLSWPAGDGLQVLSVRVARLDEAVITYTFTPADGSPRMSFDRGSHDGRFRGVNAPPELASNDPLLGTLTEHAVASDAFDTERIVSVYRPPEHVPGEQIPVVYATDGNMFAPYARRLDAAIEAGICPRVVVVAAHAAPMDQIRGNIRALEYLRGFDDARFAAHQRFFIVELAAWAERELGVAREPAQRGLFGCSDGGGHALSTALLNPSKFAHVFAFSTGTPPEPVVPWDIGAGPFVHLCAGTLEPGFHQATAAWAGYLDMIDAPNHFTERVAGHDLIQWAEELPRALARAWG